MERLVIDDSVIVEEVTEVPESEGRSTDMDVGRILGLLPVFILILVMLIRVIFVIYKSRGQKTRNSQQRRTYMGTRQRPSDSQAEPTIYVSPANLPPPPKYEAMAPPSYEEVVGLHYPSFQPAQPITQPITAALAQSSNSNTTQDNTGISTNTDTNRNDLSPSTVVTVTNERAITSTS